jgi:hypothetical protein
MSDQSIRFTDIDPPFSSNRNYEIFWGDMQEEKRGVWMHFWPSLSYGSTLASPQPAAIAEPRDSTVRPAQEIATAGLP